jgi:hypothetical protein
MSNPDEKQWTFWDALLNRNPEWDKPDEEDEDESHDEDE